MITGLVIFILVVAVGSIEWAALFLTIMLTVGAVVCL
jgi:hypothetical protein